MKTVSVLCVLALLPVAALASEMPAAPDDASDARCAAHQAAARVAATRVSSLRRAAKRENAPTTDEFMPTYVSSAWIELQVVSARNGLIAFDCAPKKELGSQGRELQPVRAKWNVGPR